MPGIFRRRFGYESRARRRFLRRLPAITSKPHEGESVCVIVEDRTLFKVVWIYWKAHHDQTTISRLVEIPDGIVYRIVHQSTDDPTSMVFTLKNEGSVDFLLTLGSGSGAFPRSILPHVDDNVPLVIPRKIGPTRLDISGLSAGNAGTTVLYLLRDLSVIRTRELPVDS